MKEVYVNVKPIKVYLHCEECGERLILKEGGFMTIPPKGRYECENGHSTYAEDGYPKIEFVEVSE